MKSKRKKPAEYYFENRWPKLKTGFEIVYVPCPSEQIEPYWAAVRAVAEIFAELLEQSDLRGSD